jgi:hypothetical protein
MRRVLLTLFLISVSGWSQAAQQPAQPPIVVQVQMPPANPWMRLVELVVPGIIGAGLALFGVWLTNKNNATENEANRKHQFEVNSRQKRWEFRKDVYTRLLVCLTGMMQNSLERSRLLNCRTLIDEKDKATVNSISADLDSNNDSYLSRCIGSLALSRLLAPRFRRRVRNLPRLRHALGFRHAFGGFSSLRPEQADCLTNRLFVH